MIPTWKAALAAAILAEVGFVSIRRSRRRRPLTILDDNRFDRSGTRRTPASAAAHQ
jgi:hypothetical protein